MDELITKKDHYDGMTNDLTKELDKHLKHQHRSWKNYIYKESIDGFYIIRYPGASRGKIVIDKNNVIIDIVLYESTFDCYLETAKSCLSKYIGKVFKIV